MATHSSILVWRVPWTEEPGGLQTWGWKELDTTEQLTHTQGQDGEGGEGEDSHDAHSHLGRIVQGYSA